ncbi:hypothetical protein HIM_03730 [Hirsutella minnesotensis 3608]|uniref:DUF4604 domain-containing protein n=1 Tax=Hirsutella minnesotensis 3608 TaxID=1043627 RepID=A0A0F7ZVM1_9HYPO|nr:hypothetical protein HIM_03730 [Hirsutella minnesotensis 3608]
MSQKITSKNLSYSSSLPPFLAALHAQATGATGPDPLAASRRRSAKKRSDSQEAEDRPLVVDDQGNAVDVELDRDGAVVEESGDAAQDSLRNEPTGGVESTGESEKPRIVEARSAIGSRKRKVGKIVGVEAGESSSAKGDVSSEKGGHEQPVASAEKKARKKGKKIKLSFDDEEG